MKAIATGLLIVCLAGVAVAQDAPADRTERRSRLQGRVAVDRRTQVIGATVAVQDQDNLSPVFLTSTGENGVFHVDGLPDGNYTVQLRRPGFDPVVKSDVELRFPFRAVVEVAMARSKDERLVHDETSGQAGSATDAGSAETVSVTGSVRHNEERVPLGDVRLRLVRLDGLDDPRSLRSETDGRFEMTALPPGRWRLEVEGVGFLPLWQTLEVTRDTTLDVRLVPQPRDYEPSPLELMPRETPIAPLGLEG